MKTIQTLLPFIFLLVFQAGCKKTDTGNNNPVDLSSAIWKTTGVAGQVIDEQSEPVEGAVVKFGNKSTTTDINGYFRFTQATFCLLYTSDAADDLLCVDLGGRRIIKKK